MPNPPSLPQDPAAERLRGRLMQQSLTHLLNRVRGSREVLPHLAALENSLGRHGPAVITSIPAHSLAKICSQLSSLPLPKDDPPLHDLLTRLMDALENTRSKPKFLPTTVGESTLVIEDVSHSEFMDVAMAHADTEPVPFESGRHYPAP
jgi:hypothetical protein